MVCATFLILLVATNPWITVRDRIIYASTLFLFWGIGLYKRSREQGHLHTIQRRLKKYESEDLSIKKTSSEYAEALSVQDKNWEHQQSVMDDRNKLFRSLVELVYQTYEPFTCCLYVYDEVSEQFFLKASKQQKAEPLRASSKEAEGVFGAAFAQKHATRLISSQIDTNHFSYYEGTAPTQVVWMVPVFFNQKKRKKHFLF